MAGSSLGPWWGGGPGPQIPAHPPQRQGRLTLKALTVSASHGRKEGLLAITALTWVRKCHTCSIPDKTESPGECPQAFLPGYPGGGGDEEPEP